MAKEIERKFIVADSDIIDKASCSHNIIQGYLATSADATVRLRIMDTKAFLTVKSRNNGAERGEWEYEIPVDDALDMIRACEVKDVIHKTRYEVGRWEIDVFRDRLEGLILAEIELTSVDEAIALPSFLGREVTDDPRYYNSVLSQTPVEQIPFR